jgi:hypothetical protein
MTRYRLPSRQPSTGDFAFYTLRPENLPLTALDGPSYAQTVVRYSLPDRSQFMPGATWPNRVMPGGTVSVLISDSHAFIFVHMRKVASTSMQSILRPLCLEPPVGRLAHLKSRARLEWDYRRYLFRIHDDILAAKRRMQIRLCAQPMVKAGFGICIHSQPARAWTSRARGPARVFQRIHPHADSAARGLPVEHAV